MGIFSYEGAFMRFLNLVANLFILHILWLLYSLPLLTIGASSTALYSTSMKLVRKQEGYIWNTFHIAFKRNFRQATFIWIGIIAFNFLFVIDFRLASHLNSQLGNFMMFGCLLCFIPYILTVLYIFPIQAKFENPIAINIKNAFLMSICHLPFTILLFVIWGSVIFLGLFFRPFTGLMICCGAGLVSFLTSTIYVMIFRKYIPNELSEDIESTGEKFE